MSYTKPRLLKGFRDHFGKDMEQRQQILAKIKTVLSSYGFQPLETPALEYQDVISPHSDQSEKLIFGFTDNGNREVSMKYDLTVPTARFAAMNWENLPKPFRRYQNQPVWRADRPGAGRFREFLQFDFDTYASESSFYDAEILLAIDECLRKIELNSFTIKLNDRRVLTGLLQSAEIPDNKHIEALRSLDKLDKIGSSGVQNEMNGNDIDSEKSTKLLSFLEDLSELSNDKLLQNLEQHFNNSNCTIGQEGIEALKTILEVTQNTGIGKDTILLSPVLARGLDYYTGPIHEVVSKEVSVGSICGGGRYDNLFEQFSNQSIPATGTSLGIERILHVLAETNEAKMPALTQVLICATDSNGKLDGLNLAKNIRSIGLSVEAYLNDVALKKQLKYANKREIPIVVLMPRPGDDENYVTVKDMESGEQEVMSKADLQDYFSKLVFN